MMKKLLVLPLLIASFAQVALADSILNFNNRIVESLNVQSIEKEDFYTIIMSEFVDNTLGDMSALIYIPKQMLTNGTHPLEVIKPGKTVRSSFYCKDDPKYKFELPSQDKIYIVFQDITLNDSGAKVFNFDGVVAVKGKEGSFTITDLTISESGYKEFLFDFEIDTNNSSYFYSSKNTDGEISCKKSLKISKVQFGKPMSQITASGNSDAAIDPL